MAIYILNYKNIQNGWTILYKNMGCGQRSKTAGVLTKSFPNSIHIINKETKIVELQETHKKLSKFRLRYEYFRQ